jgi:hypothetical protein
MTKGATCSRWSLVFCGAAIVAGLSGAMAQRHVVHVRLDDRSRVEDSERDLASQIGARSGCDQADLDALRDRVGRFRIQLGPSDSWNRLAVQFGKGWKAEGTARDDWKGYSVQEGELRMRSPDTSDWPAILETVKALECTTGVRITGFEMRTSGEHERRSVDLVRIAVAIQMQRPKSTNITQ